MTVSDNIEVVWSCGGFYFSKYGEMKMKKNEEYCLVENFTTNVVVSFNFLKYLFLVSFRPFDSGVFWSSVGFSFVEL